MAVVGYGRVSTVDQDLALQEDALTRAGAARIFMEKIGSTVKERPMLAAAIDYCRPGDVLLVWRLDRLGRSVLDLLHRVQELQARGIELRSLHEQIDTTTATGRMLLTMFAMLAQFERDLIRERTIAGMRAARKRGKNQGRKEALGAKEKAMLLQLYDSREIEIAPLIAQFRIARGTLYRYVHQRNRAREAEAKGESRAE